MLDNEINSLYEEAVRAALQIKNKIILEGVYDPGILKCIFMAGGPGSGKSYVVSEIFGVGSEFKKSFTASGLKVSNSDTAFETMLKNHGINPKELDKIQKTDPDLWKKIAGGDGSIRDAAKRVTATQKKFYEQGRLGMIVDGTGHELSKIAGQRDRAQALGYDCYMIFVNTTLPIALSRNRTRDRVLPENIVTSYWRKCQSNLNDYKSLFGSSRIQIIENSERDSITPVVKKHINKFVNSPVINSIGREWIETAKTLKKNNVI